MSAAAASSARVSKSQRVLACVLCQQRKIKCDRKFPCANCVKSRSQCVPATQVSSRRRRFPERELLERVRKYESLLHQHKIKFDSLHGDTTVDKEAQSVTDAEASCHSDAEQAGSRTADCASPTSTTNISDRVHKPRNFWRAMKQESRASGSDTDSSDEDEAFNKGMIKAAWVQSYKNNDHLLFSPLEAAVDISTLHPDPVQIFRLWQIYLDNINPLLKVTHTPTLQARIIEAAGDVSRIGPELEALMFSIYCVSILTLVEQDCQTMFRSSKADLWTKYRFGCQQALSNCSFLRSSDRDCLTALYLYLVSVRSSTVPPSLFAMLGMAIRIAQRMGIDNESTLAKCTPHEAEMRRRLWWSLVFFDARIGEMSDTRSSILSPLWDCRTPLNVSDSDLRVDMKELPQAQDTPTEAFFVVVRSEMGNFVRNTTFHLTFTNPALKSIVTQHGNAPRGDETVSLEKIIDEKYLKFCNLDNPLHYTTFWSTRAYLAKCRLVEHYSAYSSSSDKAEAQRNAGTMHAFDMLQCDTKLVSSPLAKDFLWLIHFYFPFTAYCHIVQSLRRQPLGDQAERAWEIMSDNYDAHQNHDVQFSIVPHADMPIFKVFASMVLYGYEARVAAFKRSGEALMTPRIVTTLCSIMDARLPAPREQPHGAADIDRNSYAAFLSTDFSGDNGLLGTPAQGEYMSTWSAAHTGQAAGSMPQIDADSLNWSAMDWDLVDAAVGNTSMPLPF